jgi:hypothetical protein
LVGGMNGMISSKVTIQSIISTVEKRNRQQLKEYKLIFTSVCGIQTVLLLTRYDINWWAEEAGLQ